MNTTPTLRLAITSLSAYSNGTLYFEWLDLDENTENKTIQECIDRVLKRGDELSGLSNSESIFISDYEWNDGENIFSIQEYAEIYTLRDKIFLLSELEPYQMKSVKFLLDYGIVNDLSEAIEKADNVVCHEGSMKDVAEDFLEQCYDLDSMPTIITSNIDYDAVAYELSICGEYFEVGSDVFQYCG